MITLAGVDVLIHTLFLEIEESAAISRVATNKVLKRFGSYLRYQCNASVVFEEISYFECIHLFHVPTSVGASQLSGGANIDTYFLMKHACGLNADRRHRNITS